MEYNTFLFDLDGTLIDSSEGIINSVIYALKKFGIEETEREKLHAFIGPPLTDSFTKYYGFSEEESWKAVDAYREYYQDKGIFECKLYDGIPDVLKAVKQAGKKALVVTSKPEVYAKQIMDHFSLTPYFTCVAGMELDGGRGTKAEVIEYAFRENGITDLKNVLMIGDREYDVIGAHKIGIDCLGILYGFGDKEEFAQAGADYVEADVAETEIVVGCGICGAIAGTALPDCSNTEQQHAQIQHILPGIAPFDISRGKRTFIDFLQKVASPTVGGQSGLPAGISTVCPLRQMLVEIEVHGIAGMLPEIGYTLVDRRPADCIGCVGIHSGSIIGIDIEAVVPAASPGRFLHPHGKIGHGGDTGT